MEQRLAFKVGGYRTPVPKIEIKYSQEGIFPLPQERWGIYNSAGRGADFAFPFVWTLFAFVGISGLDGGLDKVHRVMYKRSRRFPKL